MPIKANQDGPQPLTQAKDGGLAASGVIVPGRYRN